MLRHARSMLVAGGILLAGCASQEPAATAATSSATPAAENELAGSEQAARDPNERICRRVQVTGTNFRRQQCFTRGELEEANRQTQEFLNSSRDANDIPGAAQ